MAEVLERLRPWLENADKPKLGQNAKYDRHVFANAGVTIRGYAHDTLLESYVIEAHKPHSLDSLVSRHLGRDDTLSYEQVCGKGPRPSPSIRWRSMWRRAIQAKMPTSPCRCTSGFGRKSRPMPG
jgi:DNA polymerase I - 3''-5'' exonuclease and polymerase domains